MPAYRLLKPALAQLDTIYEYTRETWGHDQAISYANQLFDAFQDIADERMMGRIIPPEMNVVGFYASVGQHFVYWRRDENGGVVIVTILHTAMLQHERLKLAFGDDSEV